VLGRSYRPAELAPALAAAGADRTVLVQAHGSADETRWMLDLASDHPFIAGVVGWADLTDPAAGAALDELADDPALVGVRYTAADQGATPWLARDDVRRGLGEVAKRGLTFDLLIRPEHLPHIPRLVEAVPTLRIVIDHLANPPIASGATAGWIEGMRAAAACPNVFCKLSGLVTRADPQRWRPKDLRPYVAEAVEAFGIERVMFGSDWPVCRKAGEYGQVVAALGDALGPITHDEAAAVWGGTAERFYNLRARNEDAAGHEAAARHGGELS